MDSLYWVCLRLRLSIFEFWSCLGLGGLNRASGSCYRLNSLSKGSYIGNYTREYSRHYKGGYFGLSL